MAPGCWVGQEGLGFSVGFTICQILSRLPFHVILIAPQSGDIHQQQGAPHSYRNSQLILLNPKQWPRCSRHMTTRRSVQILNPPFRGLTRIQAF